jgi:hypothetical protein
MHRRWLLLVLLLATILSSGKARGKGENNEQDDDRPSSHRKPMFLRRRMLARPAGTTAQQHYSPFMPEDWVETAIEFGENLEDQATQFSKDASDFLQELLPPEPRIFLEMQQTWDSLHRNMGKMQQQFRNSLLKNVFHQRVGWERVRHSARNLLGTILGIWVTFQGQSHPRLAYHADAGGGGSLSLHFAQVFQHYFLDATCLLIHFTPWSHDLASGLAAHLLSTWGLPRAHSTVVQVMPHVLLVLTLLPLWSLVLEEWSAQGEQITHSEATFPVVFLATALSFGALKLAKIPVPLAASSLSGSILIYNSMRAEIVGNYINMLETCIRLLLPTLRLIRGLIKLIWRPALLLWRGWLKENILNLLDPDREKDLLGLIISKFQQLRSIVQLLWTTITYPIHKFNQALAKTPVVQAVNALSKRLQRAIKPVVVPLAIATWGVAVQLRYITNIGQVWKIFRLSINPVSFARGQVKGFFSPESRTRKAVIRRIRSLPWRLSRRRQVQTS